MKIDNRDEKPDIYFFGCSEALIHFIRQTLPDCYRFAGDGDPLPWYSCVVVADRTRISSEEWSEFIDFRYGFGSETNWLILLDEEHYELPLDKRYSRLSTSQEVLGKLVELYNCNWQF